VSRGMLSNLRALAALGLLVMPAGCATTKPTAFYTLSRTTDPQAPKLSAKGLVIGLGPLTIPQYLDRPDIVTREGANQMRLAEFNKWAEPLEPLLTRIMAEDLYTLLDASDVIPIPQRGDVPLDRVVEVDIGRFDADASGQVVLDARWRVYKGDSQTLLASGRSKITEQGTPVPGYDGIVAAMSQALGRASDEIARAIAAPPQAPARRARPSG
jgi:uncharacterized protein